MVSRKPEMLQLRELRRDLLELIIFVGRRSIVIKQAEQSLFLSALMGVECPR